METFIEPKALIDNSHFQKQRVLSQAKLDINAIDVPIIDIISGIAHLNCCFTLQSCYGHFLIGSQQDPYNIEPLPVLDSTTTIEYRIAYIAFCIANSISGQEFLFNLKKITENDTGYIQFGCAEWFWKKQVNSYALQVEPIRFKDKDRIFIDYQEALYIEKVRNRFFDHLRKMVFE